MEVGEKSLSLNFQKVPAKVSRRVMRARELFQLSSYLYEIIFVVRNGNITPVFPSVRLSVHSFVRSFAHSFIRSFPRRQTFNSCEKLLPALLNWKSDFSSDFRGETKSPRLIVLLANSLSLFLSQLIYSLKGCQSMDDELQKCRRRGCR